MHPTARQVACAAALLAALPAAQAAFQITGQAGALRAQVYSQPEGGVVLAGAPGWDESRAAIPQGSATPLAPQQLSTQATVANALQLTGNASLSTTTQADRIELIARADLREVVLASPLPETLSAGATVRARARMTFSLDTDTWVSVAATRDAKTSLGANLPGLSLSYALAQVIAVSDGVDTFLGAPALLTQPLSGIQYNGQNLLRAGHYVIEAEAVIDTPLRANGLPTYTPLLPGWPLTLATASAITLRTAAAVPEPGTWALMALGLTGVGLVSRRRVHA